MASSFVLSRSRAALLAVASVGLVVTAEAASAAVTVVGNSNEDTAVGYVVSSSDLLQAATGSVNDGNNIRSEEGTSAALSVLTNGTFGIPAAPGQSAVAYPGAVAVHNGTVITYAFDTTASPLGYSLSSIETYTGWGDSGRDDQQYDVVYSTVAAPGVFLPLASVNYQPTFIQPSNSRVTISDSNALPIATGVAALRFSFPTVENGFVGYRELDAFGAPVTAAIPEPASLGLLAAGGLLALRRRRLA